MQLVFTITHHCTIPPTKWSHFNHRSGVYQGKSAGRWLTS